MLTAATWNGLKHITFIMHGDVQDFNLILLDQFLAGKDGDPKPQMRYTCNVRISGLPEAMSPTGNPLT